MDILASLDHDLRYLIDSKNIFKEVKISSLVKDPAALCKGLMFLILLLFFKEFTYLDDCKLLSFSIAVFLNNFFILSPINNLASDIFLLL